MLSFREGLGGSLGKRHHFDRLWKSDENTVQSQRISTKTRNFLRGHWLADHLPIRCLNLSPLCQKNWKMYHHPWGSKRLRNGVWDFSYAPGKMFFIAESTDYSSLWLRYSFSTDSGAALPAYRMENSLESAETDGSLINDNYCYLILLHL